MQILSLLVGVFQFIDQLYKSLIGILWYACVYYGLNPHYAFLLPFLTNHGYLELQETLFNGFYFQFSVIILLIASIAMLIINSFTATGSSYSFLLKWMAYLLLGGVSFFVVSWLLTLIGSVYGIVFSSTGTDWYNFLNFSSSSFLAQGSNSQATSLGVMIEIFALTGYFVSVTSLLALLMIRQALMLVAVILVPFATVLGSTKKGARFSSIIWDIVIEMSLYPFLVLLCLYMAHLFATDIPLQLAFLFLPTVLPGLLFASGNSFLSAPIFGFLGGLSLSGAASKGIEAASIASLPFRGGSVSGAIKDGALLPVREKNFVNQVPRSTASKSDLPWKEIMDEEMKFRKEGFDW